MSKAEKLIAWIFAVAVISSTISILIPATPIDREHKSSHKSRRFN